MLGEVGRACVCVSGQVCVCVCGQVCVRLLTPFDLQIITWRTKVYDDRENNQFSVELKTRTAVWAEDMKRQLYTNPSELTWTA